MTTRHQLTRLDECVVGTEVGGFTKATNMLAELDVAMLSSSLAAA